MFAVIFEVQPKHEDRYLELAKQLRPELERIEGFIENERYRSRRTAGRVLSLSIWADEKAVIRWRTHAMHHGVQEKGRFEVFQDYHLRVGEVIADTAIGGELQQQRFDATTVGTAQAISIVEGDGADRLEPSGDGLVDAERYKGITMPGKPLLLISWRDAAAAEAWQPSGRARHRRVRVIRDYGMADRREAPQYYPDVARPGRAR